jgi:hypothetical protein
MNIIEIDWKWIEIKVILNMILNEIKFEYDELWNSVCGKDLKLFLNMMSYEIKFEEES